MIELHLGDLFYSSPRCISGWSYLQHFNSDSELKIIAHNALQHWDLMAHSLRIQTQQHSNLYRIALKSHDTVLVQLCRKESVLLLFLWRLLYACSSRFLWEKANISYLLMIALFYFKIVWVVSFILPTVGYYMRSSPWLRI